MWVVAALVLWLLLAAPAAAQVPEGNLVVNGGAEAGPGAEDLEVVAIPAWSVEGSFTAVEYGAPGFPSTDDSGLWSGGANFFAGGPGTDVSSATQRISVRAAAPEIDEGRVTMALSAMVGGYNGQEDSASVFATALNADGRELRTLTLPPVTLEERNATTTLLSRAATAAVPRGTRSVTVRLVATNAGSNYNDGYVDNVSLTLAASGAARALPTPVFRRAVVVQRVSGTVRLRRPGSRAFVELDTETEIPLGTTIDTKRGVVVLTSVPRAGGTEETARFRDGTFVVRQRGAITELALRSRRLWGNGRGAFRIRGRYSAATMQRARALVQDTRTGTLTRVRQGSVSVRDRVRRRTVTVRAGERYTATPRRTARPRARTGARHRG
jgi:hypothetical protein